MRSAPTKLSGVMIVEAEPHEDARGGFARLYCPNEFRAAGIDFAPCQINLSRNHARHTLRGMHYQDAPYAEAKLVRVTRGRAFDVAVDLRAGSATRGQWTAVELDAARMNAVFVPEGFAHGFLTLEPETDVLYQMGRIYEPGHAKGVRWNDPAFAIRWPAAPAVIDPRDAGYPDWR